MTKWEKILGGYATGTLTAAERASLLQAALSDQALFDVLMDEEALRETLADPATRAVLLRALEPTAKTQAWWRNPWPWTGLGAVAAAVALILLVRPIDAPQPVQMAQNRSVATAPEPLPTIIETPKLLRLDDAQSAGKAGAGAQTAPGQMALAPPPPPVTAPAAPPAPAPERSQSASARTDGPAARGAPARTDAPQTALAAPPPRATTPAAAAAPAPERSQSASARTDGPAARGAPARTDAPQTALAPPPPRMTAPAAAAAQPAERRESASVRTDTRQHALAAPPAAAAPAARGAPVLLAKKKETFAQAASEPLAVTLSYQANDGSWRVLALQSAVPAHSPLRLEVTSSQAGLLVLQPPLAEPRNIFAGIAAEIALSAQPVGPLRLRLVLLPSSPEALGRVARDLREGESSARADSAVPPLSTNITREIRLRIE